MPQMALGLIPTHNVAPPQSVSNEEIHRQFQKKLEELEQQVRGQNSKCGFPLAEEQKKRKTFFSHGLESGFCCAGLFRSHGFC